MCGACLCVWFVSVCEGGDLFARPFEFKYFGHWFVLHSHACLFKRLGKTPKCEWPFPPTQQISSISWLRIYAAGMPCVGEAATWPSAVVVELV